MKVPGRDRISDEGIRLEVDSNDVVGRETRERESYPERDVRSTMRPPLRRLYVWVGIMTTRGNITNIIIV